MDKPKIIGGSLYVPVGGGAHMTVPTNDECWNARYAPTALSPFAAADHFDSYQYLVLECTKEEAWRRIKLMRAALKSGGEG